MQVPHDLSALLTGLRAEGVPIGPDEIARLAHVFAQKPVLDRRELRELLACTLVKGPVRRSCFDSLFDAWCPEDRELNRPTVGEDEPEGIFATPPGPSDQLRSPGSKEGIRDTASIPEPEPEPESGPIIPETPKTDSKVRRWFPAGALILMGLVVIGTLLFWYWPEPPRTDEIEPSPPPELKKTTAENKDPSLAQDTLDPVPEFRSWVPGEITYKKPPRLPPGQVILLGIAAWLAALWVYFRYRRRRPRPIPKQVPLRRPGWVPLARAERAEGRLIDSEARRRLVWNVGRFQSEELTRRIDLAATAQATARAGGVVEIRREQAVYPREIWLWEDELCTDPALPALAAELEKDLSRAGLVVRRGGFAELPRRVCWSGDDCIQPLLIDGHQRNAMVAVLTDGEGLVLALESGLERRRTRGLLAGLRHWPRLVFVDFSATGRVAGLVAPFGLACIRPEELHRWLGGETVFAASAASEIGPRLVGEERLWAAACALGSHPLTSEEALALHGHLGLRCPTWSYRRLAADAGNDRLSWSTAARYGHINWFIGSERSGPDGKVPDSSRLGLAVAWWRRYLERDAGFRRRHEGALTPWRFSPAQRERVLEIALLDLFIDPTGASRSLDRLARQGLEKAIQERLAEFAARDQRPLDNADPRDAIYLPWAIGDLRPEVQIRLRQLGFGGNRYREVAGSTRTPGRLGLVLTALTALGLVGIGAGVWHRLVPPGVEIRSTDPRFDTPMAAESILRRVVPHSDGGYRVTLGTARYFEVVPAEPGERLTVTWSQRPLPSETQVGDWTVWRAGIWATPLPSGDPEAPERSVVLLRGAQDNPAVRRLGLRLLDTGSAQSVTFLDPDTTIEDIAAQLPKLLAPGLSHQLILIDTAGPGQDLEPSESARTAMSVIGRNFEGPYAWVQADAAELTQALDFFGRKPLADLPIERIVQIQGDPTLRGRSFLTLPGGSFVMGSPEEEPNRYSDEGPRHQVRVPDFAIMATEVTNAQYAAFLNAAGRRGTQDRPWFESRAEDSQSRIEKEGDTWRASPGFEQYPVVNVSWYGARAFCAHYGGRLPTEAEWEYAARAGTTTAWSFGANASDIGEYAWYSDNSGNKPHPVAGKRPNPWGLYDMHGNLWEWVEDCWHDNYRGAPNDGSAWVDKDCTYRVVRGGSFFFSPRFLRSANRDRDRPVYRDVFFGFRCVRSLSPGMGPLTD